MCVRASAPAGMCTNKLDLKRTGYSRLYSLLKAAKDQCGLRNR